MTAAPDPLDHFRAWLARTDMERAMLPDPTKEGIFRDHNCGGCQSGALPCREGNSRNCSWPRARND